MVTENTEDVQVDDILNNDDSGITDYTSELAVDDPIEGDGDDTDVSEEPQAPQQTDPEPAPAPEPVEKAPAFTEAQRQEYENRVRLEIEERDRQAREQQEQVQKRRDDLGNKARSYMQQLEQKGYLPQQAEEQARMYIQNEQQKWQNEERTTEIVGNVEGRHEATLHFMHKYGLLDQNAIDTIRLLKNSADPDQMEREASRIKKDRERDAELTELRQSQVRPQTFDSSQGAAEASTSNDRLLKAYENGDRSEAAVRAARNLTLGG